MIHSLIGWLVELTAGGLIDKVVKLTEKIKVADEDKLIKIKVIHFSEEVRFIGRYLQAHLETKGW